MVIGRAGSADFPLFDSYKDTLTRRIGGVCIQRETAGTLAFRDLVEQKKALTGPGGEEKEQDVKLLLRYRDFLNYLRRSSWLVHAEGLFRQEVTRGGESPRSASHADVPEFAATALPFKVVVVA